MSSFSEQSLLKALLEWMQVTDPDVLVGHDVTNVDLSLLLHRMQHQKVLSSEESSFISTAKTRLLSGRGVEQPGQTEANAVSISCRQNGSPLRRHRPLAL